MFKLSISDTVLVPVKGHLTGEDGRAIAIDFDAVMRRDDNDVVTEAINAIVKDGAPASPFVRERLKDWRRVLDDTGAPAAFTPENVDAMLRLANVAMLITVAYQAHVGARVKN